MWWRLIGMAARKSTCHALKRCGGHVEEQFSQMGAAFGVAQIFVDGLAPACAQTAAHHFLHGISGLVALAMWRAVHRHGDGMNDQLRVHGEANVHVVNRLLGLPSVFAGNIKQVGFGITQMGFDVPQAVFTLIAVVAGGAGVGQSAEGCSGECQNKRFQFKCKINSSRTSAMPCLTFSGVNKFMRPA